MKKLFLLFTFHLSLFTAYSQNIGIGTNAPNASALLDISSTNKGLLIPRMTTQQRQAITSPANGLLVYDTDTKELFHHNGTAWRTILNSLIWTPSPTRRWVYNFADSVGIGTSTPDERLQVVGNIKTSGRVEADGAVEAGGLSTSGGLYVVGTSILTGRITTYAPALFYSDITATGNLTINSATAILNLQASGDDKAFIQLSGDDLRVGTFSSNTNGRFIIRNGGANNVVVQNDGRTGIGIDAPAAQLHINSGTSTEALRLQGNTGAIMRFMNGSTEKGFIYATGTNMNISTVQAGGVLQLNSELYIDKDANRTGVGTSLPAERLHVNGNMQVDGKVKSASTGANNMLAVCYGRIWNDGSILSGSGNFSVVKAGTGEYHIYCNQVGPDAIILLSFRGSFITGHTNYQTDKVVVYTYRDDRDALDASFQFAIFNP